MLQSLLVLETHCFVFCSLSKYIHCSLSLYKYLFMLSVPNCLLSCYVCHILTCSNDNSIAYHRLNLIKWVSDEYWFDFAELLGGSSVMESKNDLGWKGP